MSIALSATRGWLLLLFLVAVPAQGLSAGQAMRYTPPQGDGRKALARYVSLPGREVRDIATGDLDNDSQPETVIVFLNRKARSGGLLVLSPRGEEYVPISDFQRRDYLPFLVRIGDVNNDGRNEILVGLFDRALTAKRVFSMKLHVFVWQGGRLQPLWFTARSYDDFAVRPLDGLNRLVELRRGDRSTRLAFFTWTRFGLWLDDSLVIDRSGLTLDHGSSGVALRDQRGRRVTIKGLPGRPEGREERP